MVGVYLDASSLAHIHECSIIPGDILYGGRAVVYALLAATDPVSSCCLLSRPLDTLQSESTRSSCRLQALVRGLKSLISHICPSFSHHVNPTLSVRSELVFAKHDTDRSPTPSRANPVVVTIELSTIQTPDFTGSHEADTHLTTDRKDGEALESRENGSEETCQVEENALPGTKTTIQESDVELGHADSDLFNPDATLPRLPITRTTRIPRPFVLSRTRSATEGTGVDAVLQQVGLEEGVGRESLSRTREGAVDRPLRELDSWTRHTVRREEQDAFSRQI